MSSEKKSPDDPWKAQKILCICPFCEKQHLTTLGENGYHIPWIGRGIPRKYCDSCKKTLYYDHERYQGNYETKKEKRERKSRKKLKLFDD